MKTFTIVLSLILLAISNGTNSVLPLGDTDVGISSNVTNFLDDKFTHFEQILEDRKQDILNSISNYGSVTCQKTSFCSDDSLNLTSSELYNFEDMMFVSENMDNKLYCYLKSDIFDSVKDTAQENNEILFQNFIFDREMVSYPTFNSQQGLDNSDFCDYNFVSNSNSYNSAKTTDKNIAIVIDTSIADGEDAPNRLESSKSIAKDFIKTLSNNDNVTIITYSDISHPFDSVHMFQGTQVNIDNLVSYIDNIQLTQSKYSNIEMVLKDVQMIFNGDDSPCLNTVFLLTNGINVVNKDLSIYFDDFDVKPMIFSYVFNNELANRIDESVEDKSFAIGSDDDLFLTDLMLSCQSDGLAHIYNVNQEISLNDEDHPSNLYYEYLSRGILSSHVEWSEIREAEEGKVVTGSMLINGNSVRDFNDITFYGVISIDVLIEKIVESSMSELEDNESMDWWDVDRFLKLKNSCSKFDGILEDKDEIQNQFSCENIDYESVVFDQEYHDAPLIEYKVLIAVFIALFGSCLLIIPSSIYHYSLNIRQNIKSKCANYSCSSWVITVIGLIFLVVFLLILFIPCWDVIEPYENYVEITKEVIYKDYQEYDCYSLDCVYNNQYFMTFGSSIYSVNSSYHDYLSSENYCSYFKSENIADDICNLGFDCLVSGNQYDCGCNVYFHADDNIYKEYCTQCSECDLSFGNRACVNTKGTCYSSAVEVKYTSNQGFKYEYHFDKCEMDDWSCANELLNEYIEGNIETLYYYPDSDEYLSERKDIVYKKLNGGKCENFGYNEEICKIRFEVGLSLPLLGYFITVILNIVAISKKCD